MGPWGRKEGRCGREDPGDLSRGAATCFVFPLVLCLRLPAPRSFCASEDAGLQVSCQLEWTAEYRLPGIRLSSQDGEWGQVCCRVAGLFSGRQ